MEHFPLLPLGLIPTLESHVLADCKTKLQALLQTLTDDPDDVSLGHYIKKEVAVIVTEIEDRRARQRIADLVLGVQTATLIEIGTKASAPEHITTSTGQNQPSVARVPASSPTLPPQRTPTQKPSTQASTLPASIKSAVSKPVPSAKASETVTPDASYGAPRRLSIKEMLAKAKASRVAANDPSVRFIIQNTGSLKLKRRGTAKAKAPKEETPEERLQKQKELRRQAAHDRLVARQAKMALKKQQHQDDASSDSASDIDAASSDSDEYVDDAVHEVSIDPLPDPTPRVEVETDERITRINNTLCSIQAAENLARIRSAGAARHAVALVSEEVPSSTPNVTAHANHEGLELCAAPTTDPIAPSGPISPTNVDIDRQTVSYVETPPLAISEDTDSLLAFNRPSNEDGTSRVDDEPQSTPDDDDDKPLPSCSSNNSCDVESTAGDSNDSDDDGNESGDDEKVPPYVPPVYDKSVFHSSIPMQLLETALDKMIKTQEAVAPPLPEWFQAQRESIEKLVTPRAIVPSPRPAQSMGHARQILHDLVASQNQIKSYQASVESTLASLAPPPPREFTPELAPKTLRPKSSKPRLAPRSTAARNSTNQETPEPTLLRRSAKSTPRLHVKAAPVLPLVPSMPPLCTVDYSKYYKNFLCIMTSFYEKASTANPKEALLQGETALRFQLKLYTIWKNVMHDYATVFGVDGLLKTSRAASYVYDGAQSTPFTAQYRINSSSRLEVFGIVAQAVKKLPDWEELPVDLGLNTTWNLLWTWSKPRVDRQTLLVWQKVNHFAGAKALTRKDMLKKSLHRYTSLGGERLKSFDIAPETFILPNDYIPFVQAFKKRGDAIGPTKNVWIMKPVALSRGRGISLLNDLGQVAYGEAVVVQKYIENPLLLDGFKFDLRLYVLVTSFNPLEAFFYQEGFVRICTHRYSSDATDINDLFMHLTNSSIQKYGDMDQVADNPVNNASTTEAGGTKASLAYLWSRLAAVHAPVEQIKEDIIHVILKSLVAGEDAIPYQVNSFDVFGYDILLDEAYRPWLIEINSSPSMARENNLDYVIKDALMHDTMRVVQPLHFDRAALIAILTRRLDDIAKERKRPNLLHPLEAEERTKRQLNADLHDILHGAVPREYGELPDELGNFLRIAPSPWHNAVMKLKRSCFRDKTPKP
ncbi:hypothetical protein SPRG_10333 [Saprolegnia parasitica CBS 223.65]|uniref:Tubulin-tyrosine ligase n=1 Tax=Saprolegnia parasitica (strain CBS 223.65) TaxID=695850 RepID=A0A067C1V7_SAPPC|nr:hypothetical protein SPRG_10333 [Saprolegnia parasitica CBS 223.65]KDO24518.1 hypothetical protein SPRG_10333 [Saprolegnia parasitica CBS 223.65]|eukprot:XP_012204780.1 hypothetical protein SPRG_10333 [Saprolegnia parasitica CBS 223.65]